MVEEKSIDPFDIKTVTVSTSWRTEQRVNKISTYVQQLRCNNDASKENVNARICFFIGLIIVHTYFLVRI